MLKNILEPTNITINDSGLYQQLTQLFIAEQSHDIVMARIELVLDGNSLQKAAFRIKSYLDEPSRVTMPNGQSSVLIIGSMKDKPVLVWIECKMYSEAIRLTIDVFSTVDELAVIKQRIEHDFADKQLPMIKWWFKDSHSDDTRDFYLPDLLDKIYPEFYPDLADPIQFLEDYISSPEAILLLAGPPGTGKTTLLRYLIVKYKLTAHVIYDESIMTRDTAFQNFLFGETEYGPDNNRHQVWSLRDIMIIEDADTLLSSRERDGNKLMSRFLNISDGLIKLPNKKLIFTTNITDFGNVDPALLRPGRCFGVLHTRPLNLAEAQAAAKVAGLPIPTERREYTLAELFNQAKTMAVRKIGFGVRH